MLKQTTIQIQDFIVNHLRERIRTTTSKMQAAITHDGGDVHDQFKMPDMGAELPRFQIRPLVAGEVDQSRLDCITVIHVEFAPFSISEKNPQISCHMIGHVFWNVNMRRELVSIRWRFNLFSADKTNAYITYL